MLDEAFARLKSNLELNDSLNEAVIQKHNAVRGVIENNLPSAKTKLIGSLQRATKIQPNTNSPLDIDILVVLGDFYDWVNFGGISPTDAIKSLHSGIGESERYNSMTPTVDEPTVSFEYKDGVKVELVPAYRDNVGCYPDRVTQTVKGRGYWIPRNGKWELADYDHEAEYITNANKTSDGYLVPTIKMLKAIKRKYFPEMSSFHLEILASLIIPFEVNQHKTNNQPISYPNLITNFFNTAKNVLHIPVKVENSCSPVVVLDPLLQEKTKKMLSDLSTYLNSIKTGQHTETAKIQHWKELFDDAMTLS